MIGHIKHYSKDAEKKPGIIFGIPCYGHKIFIPSNKSLIMKKNPLFSLIVLFTVFAGFPCNTTYQTQSFHYKTYSINNNVQKKPVGAFENLMANKLKNEESHDMIISLSQPGDQYKEGNKISVVIPPKQTSDVNAVIFGHSHKFLDNLIIFEYKKGYDFIVGRAGRAGIISERLDFEFTKFWGRNLANYHTNSVSQKTEG